LTNSDYHSDDVETAISIKQLLHLVENCKSFRENLVYDFDSDIPYTVDLLKQLCEMYNKEGQKLQVGNLSLEMANAKYLEMDDIKLLRCNIFWKDQFKLNNRKNDKLELFPIERLWTVPAEHIHMHDYNTLTEDHVSKLFNFIEHLHDEVVVFYYSNGTLHEEEKILWFVEQLGAFQPPVYGKKYEFKITDCNTGRTEEFYQKISEKLKTALDCTTNKAMTLEPEIIGDKIGVVLYNTCKIVIEKLYQ